MKMTPCMLEVFLHYYVSPAPHERFSAPAVQESICFFLNNGLFEHRDSNIYGVTEKGKAWIDAVLATPLPIAKWIVEKEAPHD